MNTNPSTKNKGARSLTDFKKALQYTLRKPRTTNTTFDSATCHPNMSSLPMRIYFPKPKTKSTLLESWKLSTNKLWKHSQQNNNSMLFIFSPLGWMFSHAHCMRRILPRAYAVLPFGLDVHMYLGFALPFGLGFEISYGLFHTPPLWVGGLGFAPMLMSGVS